MLRASLLLLAPPTSGADAERSPAESALATEVRTKGWIVYGARSTAGDWDLFGCRPDGSDVRPLTRTPVFSEHSPQVSRDGRQLLYRRVPRAEQLDNNRHGEQGELILARVDGSQPIPLGKPGELPWASFSPDGSQIASLSIKGIAFFDLERRTVVRTLPRQGFFQQMTWSPDGQWLCGVANAFGTGWSIARMEVMTGEAAAVNRVDCCTPDWFPDSHHLIFSWRPPGQQANRGYGWTQLWRATLDGTSRQLLYAQEGRHTYGGHVSPDGAYTLFTGNMAEDGDPQRAGAPMTLMRLSDAPIITGASPEMRALHPQVNAGPLLTLPVGWEPCWTLADVGSRLTPLTAPSAPGTSTSTPTRPTTSSSADLNTLAAELRPKGWLAFSAKTDAGDWDLFLMRPDGSDRRPLTHTADFNEAGVRFSPDGKQLLYYRLPRSEPVDNNTYGTYDLVLANADGTQTILYGRGFSWATWGPAARQIAVLSPKSIQIVDVATRAVLRELPRQGLVSQLAWSPDGRWFAGTANGLGPYWNIGCLNADTGAIHAVSETERYNCTPDWTADSQRILYARGIIPPQNGHAELWVTAADGTDKTRLYAETDHHLYGACPSPDGRHVLFTRSREDLGQVPAIEMAIVRWPVEEAANPDTVPRLDLGPGWEPHWTAHPVVP